MALELDDDYETLEAALALIDTWDVELGTLPSTTSAGSFSPSSPPSSDDCDAQSTTTSASTEGESDDARSSSSAAVSPSAAHRRSTSTNPRRRKERDDETHKVVPTLATATQMSRRDELVFLRRKVRELETVLTTIKGGNDNDDELVKHEDAVHGTKELDACWVWQQIATRQLEHRHASERRNLQLRVQVEEQIKIAKDLMRVLLRAYRRDEHDETSPIDRHGGPFKRVKLPRDARTEVSEADQLQRVAELLDESSAVFAAAPFTGGAPVFRDVNVLEHANGESTINLDSSWVVPFPVDQVMSAFWTHLMRKTKSDRQCTVFGGEPCGAADDGREVLVTRYESNAIASKFAGKFFGRFVARRAHPDGDQPGIIIMDMCADPVGFKPLSMEGVRLHRETLMRVVWADQALGSNGSTSSFSASSNVGRMALIQMSERVHVQLAATETPTRRRRVGALTEFMMCSVEGELNWKQDVLETLLMRSVSPSMPLESYVR